jgi:hypothetical protein
MGRNSIRRELRTVEAFKKVVGEEISVSAELDLPLTMLVARVEGEWREGDVRRALGNLRATDLVAHPDLSELLIVLPSTEQANAQVVEVRLRRAIPEANFGVAI